MSRNLDVKSRLGEITRRSAELSAMSLKLADMASQLDRLRKLNSKIEFLGHRNSIPARQRRPVFSSNRFIGTGWDRT